MITRVENTLVLTGPCTVEDAEPLLSHVHAGVEAVDLTGCTLLHTACLQVLLAARVSIAAMPAGTAPAGAAPAGAAPADAALAQWITPVIQAFARTEF